MATKKIKGITIEIGGDTSSFVKSLKEADSAIRQTNQNLKSVNQALKLDPGNTDLLKQKQQLLADSIKNTENRLKELKSARDKAEDPAIVQALNAEIAETEVKLKQAKKEADEFGSVLEQKMKAAGDSLKDVGSKLTDAGKTLTTTVTAPLAGLATVGVSYNAQIEQYKTLLTTLTGSAEQADKIIKQLQEDASKSPFDTASFVEANQYLLSAGESADVARENILNLANAVAATGGGSAELNRMAQNLQQIKNVGKASAQDIKQFANAGINVYGLLADSLGMTVEQVKDLDVTYDDLAEAFAKASQEGGIYFGAMEAQSETLNGQMSTLKDNFQQTLGELTQEFLPVIKDLLANLNEFLLWLKSLDPETKKVVTTIALVVAAIGPLLIIAGQLATAIGALLPVIGAVTAALGTTVTVMGALSAPIGLVIAALVAVGLAVYEVIKHWDDLKAIAKDTCDGIAQFFETLKNILAVAWDAMKDKASETWQNIKDGVTEKYNNIKDTIINTWENIKTKSADIIKGIIDDMKEKFERGKDKVKEVIEAIKSFFNFDFKWPHIPLPHFSISGSANPMDWFYGGLPHINVEWYKKAANTPYLFNSPQVIGVGDVPEVVIGADAFKKMSGSTVINQTINATVRNDQDIEILARKISEQIQTDVNGNCASWR